MKFRPRNKLTRHLEKLHSYFDALVLISSALERTLSSGGIRCFAFCLKCAEGIRRYHGARACLLFCLSVGHRSKLPRGYIHENKKRNKYLCREGLVCCSLSCEAPARYAIFPLSIHLFGAERRSPPSFLFIILCACCFVMSANSFAPCLFVNRCLARASW